MMVELKEVVLRKLLLSLTVIIIIIIASVQHCVSVCVRERHYYCCGRSTAAPFILLPLLQ